MPRRHHLPPNIPPRGLARDQAAAYCGVSGPTFDIAVDAGVMPPAARCFGSRLVWDRKALDLAWDRLSGLDKPPADDAESALRRAIDARKNAVRHEAA